MRLAVFGSRSLHGAQVRSAIIAHMQTAKATHLVTAGEPDGVCREAQNVARESSGPITLHWLQPKERAAGKYHWRSVAVLSDCDAVLFVWDGKSKGTANEKKLADKKNTPCTVLQLNPILDSQGIEDAIAKIREAD